MGMGVHQGTVDSYLEEVLMSTVEQAAQSRALAEARLKAAKINQVVDTLEAAQQDPEVVVREPFTPSTCRTYSGRWFNVASLSRTRSSPRLPARPWTRHIGACSQR